MPDEFKVRIVTEADTSGAKEQVRAQEQIAESAKEVEKETAEAAKQSMEAQKQAAKEAAKAVEEAKKREVAAAKEAAKEAEAAAKKAADAAAKHRQQTASDARSLDGFIRSGANLSQAGAWAEEASRVFGDFGGKTAAVSKEADLLAGGLGRLNPILTALAVALPVMAKLLHASVEEFGTMEDAVAKLDAALANGGLLNDQYRESLQALAGTLEDETTIGAEHWLTVLTRLTQFGADSTNIKEYANAVKNLAGIMGGDIESSAAIFGRAMKGGTGGLEELGIKIDQTASVTERLQQIMDQAAEKGAGQLASRATTLTGEFAKLKAAIGGVFEGIGNMESPFLKGGARLLTDLFKGIATFYPQVIQKTGDLANKERDLSAATAEATSKLEIQKAVLTGTASQAEALAASYERARRAQQGDQQREDELMAAKQAREEAKVDAQQKAGRLTPEQASAAKEIVRGRFEKEKFDRSQKTKQDEIVSRTKETNELEKGAVDAAEKAKASGQEADQTEANRLSDLFVKKAAENAAAIEQLRKDLEHEAKLFILKQETRSVQAKGENIEARRKAREVAQGNTPAQNGGGARAEAVSEARGIAADAKGIKGPSPESTARIERAAQALNDGASEQELDALNRVLDQLATSLEKRGKSEDSKPIREMQQRIVRLEGVVRRLESQQGGSGS